MTQKKKSPRVLIVFGTRPELIKIAPILSEIKKAGRENEFLLVNTAQQNDLLKDQLEFWDLHPDIIFANENVEGNLVRLLTSTLNQLQDVLNAYPSLDYVLVQGDTNSALACANLAFLNNKKLLHVEAGLRTYNFQSPFPEEYNRVIASRVAWFHFAHSENARQNLLKEGVPGNKILVTGNTVVDALQMVDATNKMQHELPSGKNNVIITMHRRENAGKFTALIAIIKKLKKESPSLNFLWIAHPNYTPAVFEELAATEEIILQDHLPYADFIALYRSAKAVITDSGGVTEEASQFGIPIVVFRSETERVEPVEMGHPILVSLDEKKITGFFSKTIDLEHRGSAYFGTGHASAKIVKWIMEELEEVKVNTVIIGGGPGGTGTILKSMKDGTFESYAQHGLALIESSSRLVVGSVAAYRVNSDTLADVFLECLDGCTRNYLELNTLSQEVQHIRQYKGSSIPLYELEQYLSKLGMLLQDHLAAHPKCRVLLETKATRIVKMDNGSFEVYLSNGRKISCTNIIVSPGATPVDSFANEFRFAGRVAISEYPNKSITADAILKSKENNLPVATKRSPKIVILGGSHSAFSVADHLLSNNNYSFEESAIKIWATKKPKLFYVTGEEALLSGYTEFTAEDICPITKRVFRLAGLRMNGRKLYMKMLWLAGMDVEKRVTLAIFNEEEKQLQQDLAEADLIIHAFGYILNMIPVTNKEGIPFGFMGEKNRHWVNENCQVLGSNGEPIENLFAMGLATGFIPAGGLGGEASFEGQTNGLWYYQNNTAGVIMDKINEAVRPLAKNVVG